jgi:hypothetical protein
MPGAAPRLINRLSQISLSCTSIGAPAWNWSTKTSPARVALFFVDKNDRLKVIAVWVRSAKLTLLNINIRT